MPRSLRPWLRQSWIVGVFAVVGGITYLYLRQFMPSPVESSSASSTATVVPEATSVVLKGTDVKGAILTAQDGQGYSLTLKIEDVELDLKDSEQDTYLYTVLYLDNSDGQWQNLCLPDRDHVAKAIPLVGHWDEQGNHIADDTITFACTNGALAKCVRWGYKPWKSVNGQSLRDFHQACTRMVVADYCGTGVAHTKDGMPIDIYDRLAIQKQVPNNGMVFEAAWSPDGAVAVNRTRLPEGMAQVQQECPERLKPFQGVSLSDNFDATLTYLERYAPGAVIFNDSGGTTP